MNFLAVCLILIPWSIVVLFHNQFWINTAIPYASKEDLGEVEALAMAVQQYAFTYGAYPPDFTSGDPRGELDRHLAQCFPNRDAELDVPFLLDELGPHNALAFWLHGFSPDPKRPIRGWGRRRILFAFDPGRLSLVDEYFPSSCPAPYVYFRSDTYEKAKYVSKPNLGTAWPYFSKRPSKMGSHAFVEPNSFQIISAGSDGVYGDKQVAASEAYLYHGHQDNLVKFCPEPLGHEGLTEQLRRHRKCCQISIARSALPSQYCARFIIQSFIRSGFVQMVSM